MTGRLDAEDLLLLLGESTGPMTTIRDATILYAAAERPAATLMGEALLTDLPGRAAALLHSIIRWKPLNMGNAGLGWRAVGALVGIHDCRLVIPPQDRMILTNKIAYGRCDSVEEISSVLASSLQAR